jgi:hypothetical protein
MHVPSATRQIIIIIRRGYPNVKHKLLHNESAILNFCDDAFIKGISSEAISVSRIISTQRIISSWLAFGVIYVATPAHLY